MKIESTWGAVLKDEIAKPYIQDLKRFLASEKTAGKIVYPPESEVFSAFLHTPFAQVKVVIIGQDPYHGKGQAHGLSFSVAPQVPLPPSLRNIFLEIEQDLGIPPSQDGCLTSWANQGVLLLNSILTVRANEAKSHNGIGWEQFTRAVVEKLLEREDPIVFIAWGKSAQTLLEGKKPHHAILTAAHPSPYSAYSGFFGCRHFSKTNALLEKWGKTPINWKLK